MSREAMQMALEALVEINKLSIGENAICLPAEIDGAMDALRQALETEQEPVAWISDGGDVSRSKRYMDEMGFKCNPLYTAPPKQWVGLTDEEVSDVIDGVLEGGGWLDVARALEAAIKDKNKW